MRPKSLSVKLVGSDLDGGDVVLGDLQNFCGALSRCLKVVEKKVETDAALVYRITGLRHGSCGLTIRPVLSDPMADDVPVTGAAASGPGEAVIDLFAKTVKALERRKPIDPRFDSADLTAFRDLAKVFRGRVRGLIFDRTPITGEFTGRIRELLAAPEQALGEVSGLLQQVTVRGKRAFTLYPNVGGPVECTFPSSLTQKVGGAIERYVTVYGRLSYFMGSLFPGRVRVDDFDVHPPDSDLPSLSEVRGILSGTGNHA